MSEKTLNPEFVQIVQEALKEVSVKDLGPVTAERELSDLGLDSVSIAELIIVLEDRLSLSLEQRDVEGLKTFADLADLVEKVRSSS